MAVFGPSLPRPLRAYWHYFPVLALVMFSLIAWSQSEDEVHIAPRETTTVPVPEADSVHVDNEPLMNAHPHSIRVNVKVVMVPVVVTDPMNRPVVDLRKENFSIYEQDKQKEIQYFSRQEAPISVGLILDLSKSMTNKLEMERAAVSEFVRNANPEDDYFVIAVSSHPQVIATSTQSLATIQSRLALAVPEGSTALLDAVYLGVSQMRSARYERRALLIISDGGDNSSRYTLKEIKNIVQESDLEISAIGLFDTALFKPYEEFMGKRWLQEITDATGGHTVTVDNLAKLPEAAAMISRELRSQYLLGYKPTGISEATHWRKIRVRLIPPPHFPALRAYYRRGYLVPEQ